MPLDVPGCTRATMIVAVSISFLIDKPTICRHSLYFFKCGGLVRRGSRKGCEWAFLVLTEALRWMYVIGLVLLLSYALFFALVSFSAFEVF